MQTEKMIRIVLADDQPFIRKGLRYILDIQKDMQVVGEASTGEEAVDIALRNVPDIVLMDIRMPGGTGIMATKSIVEALPDTKVVLLTTFDVEQYVFDGIRAGASGYLLKDTETDELLSGIRAMHRGATLFNSSTAKRALDQILTSGMEEPDSSGKDRLLGALTERETEVLQLLAYGKRNHEISAILCISEGTTKTHIHHIMQKLEAQDRTQAVVTAIRMKLVK
ncbi:MULTISPECIES: response regulator [Paenibacillus]|jgi:DNA-binding NarL/FixJ family response regulator|uniref:Response regulator n=1 Tax=Paenibacillus mendelii TaxID=206163 RepID=A0ABV6JIG6_9BACL|nr:MULTISPECIES: response regulator transcription factor [Paenibacillus]MBC9205148.1 response regulator transcription factor [Paenibacillus sp. PL91]MCQ6564074.1 response regulator transcription factor [Paenibacillus mendelii]